jgi:translation initiation factor IF-2
VSALARRDAVGQGLNDFPTADKYPKSDSKLGLIMAEELEVGKVSIFFAKPSVAAVEITSGTLAIGDPIKFKGATTNFEQRIESMEIDRKPVPSASTGQSVGIKVKERVRPNDRVYKLVG